MFDHFTTLCMKAVKNIKTCKSPANDHNVTAEALKQGRDQLIYYLRQIFNMVLHSDSEKHQCKGKKLSFQSLKSHRKARVTYFRGISLILLQRSSIVSFSIETVTKFLHSYVHSKQDLEEEKVALSNYTSSGTYLNNTIRRTFL